MPIRGWLCFDILVVWYLKFFLICGVSFGGRIHNTVAAGNDVVGV
jgi:hypothetical protein